MNRQEAIKVLLRNGKQQDVLAAIQSRVRKAAETYADIRSDTSRTEDYKRWEMASAASHANRALTEDLANMASRVVSYDRDDAGKVFGTVGISGDPASLVISRRDAGDRVAGIVKGEELRELLARATRSGDEVLARAIAERALEIGDASTLHQFVEDRPKLEQAVERLWTAERAQGGSFDVTVQLLGLMPEELGSMSFDAIDNLAEGEAPGSDQASMTTFLPKFFQPG